LGALLLKGEEGRGREGRRGRGERKGKERAMSPPPSIWRKFTPMLTTDKHEASRGLSVTVELLV